MIILFMLCGNYQSLMKEKESAADDRQWAHKDIELTTV